MLPDGTVEVLRLLRPSHLSAVLAAVRRRLFSRSRSLGFARALDSDIEVPRRVKITVRPVEPSDELSFLDVTDKSLSADAVYERLIQQRLLAAQVPTCWLGLTAGGEYCYMHWLVLPEANAKLRSTWGAFFPPLEPTEALLEGLYIPEKFRGRGYPVGGVAALARVAESHGIARLVTYIDEANTTLTRWLLKVGFEPFCLREQTWIMFRRHVRFTPIDKTALDRARPSLSGHHT
jgi:GNAT superfamily N-acetyltransferase